MEQENIRRIVERKYLMTDIGRINNIRQLYTEFSPNVDYEALCSSAFFPALEEMMAPVLDNFDDSASSNVAYWKERGMVKECHGANDPVDWDDYERKNGYRWDPKGFITAQNSHVFWNSYVPVSACAPENKGRKYPTIFVLHGANNGMFLMEGWGFIAEAARREWIVIVPALEVDDFILDILEQAKQLYPIDESRVYAAGFSYGGWCSNRLGNKYPEIFAAVAPCGSAMDSGFTPGDPHDREPIPPFDGIPRALALNTYMPIINCYGDCDGNRFPFYDFKGKAFGLVTHTRPQDLIDGINSWARVNKVRELTLEGVMALKEDPDAADVEKETGIPLEKGCGNTFYADGVRFHTCDFRSEDGIVRMRILAEMNIPHWPTPEMVRQIFAFFSHFSRDPKTAESIYHA